MELGGKLSCPAFEYQAAAAQAGILDIVRVICVNDLT